MNLWNLTYQLVQGFFHHLVFHSSTWRIIPLRIRGWLRGLSKAIYSLTNPIFRGLAITMGQLTTETKSWDPILAGPGKLPHHPPYLQGTGGTRMVHRQQLFAKLLMLDAEASNRNWALAEPNQPFWGGFWKNPVPIRSMYDIFTFIWQKFSVNVGKYTIRGSYQLRQVCFCWIKILNKLCVCVCTFFGEFVLLFFQSRMYMTLEWCAYKVRLVFLKHKLFMFHECQCPM